MSSISALSFVVYGGLSLALAVLLLAVSVIDAREMRIPDVYNASILGLGVLACLFLQHQTATWGLFSASAAFAIMRVVQFCYRGIRKVEGLGTGDIKFIGAAACWIGLETLPLLILITAMAALGLTALGAVFGRPMTRATRVPLGPFLAISFAMLWMMKLWNIVLPSFFDF